MKYFKKIISASIVVLCISLSANMYGQGQQNMSAYNSAVDYYNNGDYGNALIVLNGFMTHMEANPSAWADAGPESVELVFKVYRLAAGCYYNSGDSDSADVIVDNLIYVLSDYFYESDIITRYNNTSVVSY